MNDNLDYAINLFATPRTYEHLENSIHAHPEMKSNIKYIASQEYEHDSELQSYLNDFYLYCIHGIPKEYLEEDFDNFSNDKYDEYHLNYEKYMNETGKRIHNIMNFILSGLNEENFSSDYKNRCGKCYTNTIYTYKYSQYNKHNILITTHTKWCEKCIIDIFYKIMCIDRRKKKLELSELEMSNTNIPHFLKKYITDDRMKILFDKDFTLTDVNMLLYTDGEIKFIILCKEYIFKICVQNYLVNK